MFGVLITELIGQACGPEARAPHTGVPCGQCFLLHSCPLLPSGSTVSGTNGTFQLHKTASVRPPLPTDAPARTHLCQNQPRLGPSWLRLFALDSGPTWWEAHLGWECEQADSEQDPCFRPSTSKKMVERQHPNHKTPRKHQRGSRIFTTDRLSPLVFCLPSPLSDFSFFASLHSQWHWFWMQPLKPLTSRLIFLQTSVTPCPQPPLSPYLLLNPSFCLPEWTQDQPLPSI